MVLFIVRVYICASLFASNCVAASDKYVNIPLHLMSNLHSLFFCARALDKNIIISVARLSEAICHIPPGTIAKELSVSLYITDVYDIELIALVTRYTVWSKLDSALAFASVRLRRVNVYFNILVAYYNRDLNLAPDRIKSTADVVNQLLFENLPLLHKAGVLQVQAGIDLFKFDED